MAERSKPTAALDEVLRANSTVFRAEAANAQQRPVDWLRLLAGLELRAPEIENGVAVDRRIAHSGHLGEVTLTEMPEWIATKSGWVVLIGAEAGEGKSTYLTMLDKTLRESAIVLHWPANVRLPMSEVSSVVGITRSLLQDGAETPAVVLHEISPPSGPGALDYILATLREHEESADDTVFVIAGRPGAIDLLSRRCYGAEKYSLAQINIAEASFLCERISFAYEQALMTIGLGEVNRRFPNLGAFMSRPLLDQMQHFQMHGNTLIVSCLRAIYGDAFVQRIVNEYREIASLDDRQAYLHVCLAMVTGIPLPEELLRSLCPKADLDARSALDPWVRNGDENHIARHGTIAQTVLEECGDLGAIERCLERWISLAQSNATAAPKLHDMIAGLGHLPVIADGRDEQQSQSSIRRLRRRFMKSLGKHDTISATMIAESNHNVPRLISWASALRSLTCTRIDSECNSILVVMEDLIREADNHPVDSSLRQRLDYEFDCLDRDYALIDGEEESSDDLLERVKKWRRLLTSEWAGPRFYADLFDAAYTLALRYTTQDRNPPDPDSEQLVTVFSAMEIAFNKLYASGGGGLLNERWRLRRQLIDRHLYYALPNRYIELLREVWDASGKHSYDTGTLYAEALNTFYKKDRARREAALDEAISVLQITLETNESKRDALFMLAEWSCDRPSLANYVREQVRAMPTSNPINAAIKHHSAALVDTDDAQRLENLRHALKAYASITWSEALWFWLGRRWHSACSAVETAGVECAEEWGQYNEARRWVQGTSR